MTQRTGPDIGRAIEKWSFGHWPMRAKLASLLVAASLLPMALWAVMDLRMVRERELSNASELLKARGDQIVLELDAFHRGHQRAAARLALFPETLRQCADDVGSSGASRDALNGMLQAYPRSDPGIRGAGLIDANGRVIVASEPAAVGDDLSGRRTVRAALRGEAATADPFISSARTGAVPTIAYLAPVHDAQRRVICATVLWVRAEALWRAVRASDALAGRNSSAVIYDRQGIRIAHTASDALVFRPSGLLDAKTVDILVAEQRFGDRTRELLQPALPFPEQFERARADAPDSAVFRGFAPLDQHWAYGVARRFESVPWTVFYMLPEATIDGQIARAARELTLVAIGIIGSAVLLGGLLAARIVRPMRALGDAAMRIAGGDLSARVADNRNDELGQLGRSFNTMAERVQAQSVQRQIAHDELERHVAERTAQLSERDAGLRRAQQLSRIGHVITRTDGSFESWSETLPILAGLGDGQMPPDTRSWMKLIHEEDRDRFRAVCIEAGVSGQRQDIEYRLRHADGHWLHVYQVLEPLPAATPDGGRMRWFNTLQDISEHKRIEQQLRSGEARMRSIIDGALDAVVTIDAAGLITDWSPQAESTFGWTRADALGRELAQAIVPAPHRDAHRRGLQRYLATGEARVLGRRIEMTALHRDGHEFPIELSITALHDGKAARFSAFARDITQRQRAETRLREQLERLQLLDQITVAIGQRLDLRSIYQVAVRSLEQHMPVDFGCVLRHEAAQRHLEVDSIGAASVALAHALGLDGGTPVDIGVNGLSRCIQGELVYEPSLAGHTNVFAQRLSSAGLGCVVLAPLATQGRVFAVLVAARRRPQAFSSGECEFLRQLSEHVALAAHAGPAARCACSMPTTNCARPSRR